MYLHRVHIKNFRSIDYLKLTFDSSLKIFVGKNESGKSSIIKALSLLSPDEPIESEDIRESLPNESLPNESYVWFVFKMGSKDISTIYENVKNFFGENLDKEEEFLVFNNKKYSLRDFCELRNEYLYHVKLDKKIKYYSFWIFDEAKKYVLSQKFIYQKLDGKHIIKNFNEIDFDDKKDKLLSATDLDNIINSEKLKIIKENHPAVLYWSYNEDNLLPSKINVSTFSSDPETCKPLKNLFQLAKISNISEEIEKARSGTANKYRNFLNKIAEHATSHFQETWKEYKDVSFSLEPNGEYIEAGIKEKNTYTFQQRSDGFKRFITFLLMVSINVKSEKLKNALILVDEPDVSLHPSGVRFLRDELKKISKNNIVVAATHSIFMINGDDINDYLIVKKVSEKTIVEEPTEKTVSSEEVLYRALDFSIYELLKDFNILFEGWRDKKLFKVAYSKFPPEHKDLKDFYKKIGISHTNGVKNVKNIVPIIELVNKDCLVVSDCDKAAREKQKEFKSENFYGDWLRYDEIDSDTTSVTGEDFLSKSLISKATTYLSVKYPYIKGEPNFKLKKGVMSNVEHWIKSQDLVEEPSTYINDFKTFLYQELKHSDILSSYYTFLKKLSEVIDVKRGTGNKEGQLLEDGID